MKINWFKRTIWRKRVFKRWAKVVKKLIARCDCSFRFNIDCKYCAVLDVCKPFLLAFENLNNELWNKK